MKYISAFRLCVAALVSCDKAPQVPFLSGKSVMEVDLEGLSGLCMNARGDGLLACGDNGDVKAVSFTGETTGIWSSDLDLEGITLDPSTGDMYLAVEGKQEIHKLAAQDYDSATVMFQIKDAVEGDFSDSGLEAVEYHRNGKVFVGSQKGAYIWHCKLDGTVVSRISVECFTSEVADLCYDPEGDCLWVLDSEKRMMYICTTRGELIQAYDLRFIENAEAICVDRKNGFVWVGSDEENPKIYRLGIIFQ